MNCFLLAFMFIFLCVTSPISGNNENPKILQFDNYSDGEGNYRFSIETLDGIQRKESGRLVNKGQPNEHLEVHGEYSYYLVSQRKYEVVRYCIDDRGYHIYFDREKPPLLIPPSASNGFGGLPPDAVASMLG